MLIFPLINDTSRKIIHIDMDAFFASIEQRDNALLRGKPIVIAKNPQETGGRGVVSTASYEARIFGIHSAMSAKEAYELCPQAIFISGNYEKYSKVSQQVREIFFRYTEKVESVSIDEAYLDVTENKIHSISAVKIAKLIQHDVFRELRLTCSAGVSYNKFLAKVASDWEKPHGLTLIKPEGVNQFLAGLAVAKFHGVGKATIHKLQALGIETGEDLQAASPLDLADKLGVHGWDLYLKANGIHNSKVVNSRPRKSIGKERTYSKFLFTEEDVIREIKKLSVRVAKSLKNHRMQGNIVVLKVRYGDFSTLTKRKTITDKFDDEEILSRLAENIFNDIDIPENFEIRLLGVTVTGLEVVKE